MSLSKGNSKFAFEIFQKASEGSKNAFLSPLSVNVTLSMLASGAKGTSRTELIEALHLNKFKNQNEINKAYQNAVKTFSESTECALSMANRLYVSEKYEVNPDFKSNLLDNYQSDAISVDFSKDVENEINAWVKSKTHNHIQNLFAPGSFDDLTRLVLVNAIYFKGDWLKKFLAQMTKPFYLNSQEKKEVKFMGIKRSYFFVHNADLRCSMVQLLYKGKRLAMYVVLPYEKNSVGRLKEVLTADKFESMRKAMVRRKVEVELPYFKMRFRRSLITDLRALNVTDVFDQDKSDLSGISSTKELYVSDVVHEAYVSVDETGTTAVACTADFVREYSFLDPPPYVQFHANHPFVFIIYDIKASVILFMGTLDDP